MISIDSHLSNNNNNSKKKNKKKSQANKQQHQPAPVIPEPEVDMDVACLGSGDDGDEEDGLQKSQASMEDYPVNNKDQHHHHHHHHQQQQQQQTTGSSKKKASRQQHQPQQRKQTQTQTQTDMTHHESTFGQSSNHVDANNEDNQEQSRPESFLMIDENEFMQVESMDEFAQKLGCEDTSTPIKVVSIFGPIGHGKSYSLNNTFYDSQQVFKTSSSQESCTIGVWAAYDARMKIITLDTEGLLGVSANCQRRTRLLLKVLAISDIVIYRTRSERLEDNLFTFLGDASRVYVQHFYKEIKNSFQNLPELAGYPLSEMGPVVIIFQETRDTEPLQEEMNQTRESIIRSRFKTLGLPTEAFSAIEYVGIRTLVRPTNFDLLKNCIKRHLKNSFSRTPRHMSVVYTIIRVLNEKFNGDIEKTVPSMFPNLYLTCPVTCLSCQARCTNSMNHHRDGVGHECSSKCVYQHQFNNHILYCRACYERGEEVEVNPKTCSSTESPLLGLAKYAWSGDVLECPRCGIINRSRQYWYGNKETWESSVRTEIRHVWSGELNRMQAAQNTAQRVLDSVNYITETVSSISAKPTKMVSEWVADQIAPSYWIPNSRILHCALCNCEFGKLDQKHHCRLCGNGLCSTCSSKSKPVPERGWGETSVRVCDRCYERSDSLSAISSLPPIPPMLINNNNNYSNSDGPSLAIANHQGSSSTAATTPLCVAMEDASSSTGAGSSSNKQAKSNNIDDDDDEEVDQHANPSNSKRGSNQQTCSSATSSSIPIPKQNNKSSSQSKMISNNKTNGTAASSSCNPTPTPHSSSIGSASSSGSNHSTHNIPNEKQQNGFQVALSEPNFAMMDFMDDTIAGSPTNQQVMQQHYATISSGNNSVDNSTITARRFGEVLQSTIKTVVSTAIDYPLGVIKDSARPDYWLPDSQITNCGSCKIKFKDTITIHHCRRCGGGFCQDCSTKSMPVPERGWGDASVRVCDKCYDLK